MKDKNWTIKCKDCGVVKKYPTYDGYYEANRLGRVRCRSCANRKRWENILERSKYDESIKLGQKFGSLTVVSSRVGPGNQVSCECECGNFIKKRAARLLAGRNNGCKKCLVGVSNHLWKGVGKIPKIAFTRIKHHAVRTHRDFNITIEYLSHLFDKQKGKCALSGLELTFGVSNKIKPTASLDRIDSNKGYIIDNVQWVHKDINWMKQDFTEQEFLDMCKKIVSHKQNDKSRDRR